MIRRIELENFMSHEHTVIDLAEGLTVLVGPNNCGKSAVVNALKVLCTNPKSNYVLRHGSKQCLITVVTDNGDRIVWSRKKSGSPKYEINGETFDRLKGKVPDRLHEILRLPAVEADKETYDVHFGEQRTPIFLLGDKEKAAAQFFASSSDAIGLVEMQVQHKADIRNNGQECERLKRERDELKRSIEVLSPLDEMRAEAVGCQKELVAIEKRQASVALMQETAEAIATSTKRLVALTAREKSLTALTRPPEIAPTNALTQTIELLGQASKTADRLAREARSLSPLEVNSPLAPTTELEQISARLEQSHAASLRIESQADALGSLKPVVAIEDTEAMLLMTHQLVNAAQRKQSMEAKASALAGLQSTQPPDDVGAMQTLIGSIEKLQAASDVLNQQLDLAIKSIAEAEAAFEKWIVDHPQCPTCGSALTVESLVHSHGGETQQVREGEAGHG